MSITQCFPTSIYRTELPQVQTLNAELESLTLDLATQDREGLHWCKRHGYSGYTSYGSIPSLADLSPAFARLSKLVEKHATSFARSLHWNLRGGRPIVDTMWVNLLKPGGSHTSHLHPNAVLSGTYYVQLGEGAAAITFEDPRHGLMMAAPPRKANAPEFEQSYVTVHPKPGTLLLWESFLRHEVPLNRSEHDRISISFNCVIA